MFRKGGSADGGITSGLQAPRQGYNEAGSVQSLNMDQNMAEFLRNASIGDMKAAADQMYQPKERPNYAKRRVGDLMIDFGIDIASRTPTGSGISGAISTALASAKDPFAKFQQSRAASEGFEDKLALGAYDVVKGEQAAEKDFEQKKDLIRLESELNPKLKKVFREEIPEVRINNYADSLQESDFEFISNNSMEIAENPLRNAENSNWDFTSRLYSNESII